MLLNNWKVQNISRQERKSTVISPHGGKCCFILESKRNLVSKILTNVTIFILLVFIYPTAQLHLESVHIVPSLFPPAQPTTCLPTSAPCLSFPTLPLAQITSVASIALRWNDHLQKAPRGSVEYQINNPKTSEWPCRVVLRLNWEKSIWRYL